MSRLDILGVEAFVAIADLGSFNAAANSLYLSQTALSRRLKKIEEDLGVVLVARTTRAVALTAAGEALLPNARQILRDLANSLQEMRTGSQRPLGAVRVGCLLTLSPVLLPAVLVPFALKNQNARIQSSSKTAIELREALLRGEIDFAVSVAGAVHPALEVEKIFREHIVVLCPESDPLALRSAARLQDLVGRQIINIGSMTAARLMVDARALAAQLRLNWAYEVNVETAVSLVCAGAGVAICPSIPIRKFASVHEAKLKTVKLQPALWRDIALLRRKLPLSPAAHALHEAMRESLRGLAKTSNTFTH